MDLILKGCIMIHHQTCIGGCLKGSLQSLFPVIHIFHSLCLSKNSHKIFISSFSLSLFIAHGPGRGEDLITSIPLKGISICRII
jgi:hypothetical protein